MNNNLCAIDPCVCLDRFCQAICARHANVTVFLEPVQSKRAGARFLTSGQSPCSCSAATRSPLKSKQRAGQKRLRASAVALVADSEGWYRLHRVSREMAPRATRRHRVKTLRVLWDRLILSTTQYRPTTACPTSLSDQLVLDIGRNRPRSQFELHTTFLIRKIRLLLTTTARTVATPPHAAHQTGRMCRYRYCPFRLNCQIIKTQTISKIREVNFHESLLSILLSAVNKAFLNVTNRRLVELRLE